MCLLLLVPHYSFLVPASPSPPLPGFMPQCNDGFVSTYRCGAVPDSNRLPFSSGGTSRRNRRPQHSVVSTMRQHDMLALFGDSDFQPGGRTTPSMFHASHAQGARRGTWRPMHERQNAVDGGCVAVPFDRSPWPHRALQAEQSRAVRKIGPHESSCRFAIPCGHANRNVAHATLRACSACFHCIDSCLRSAFAQPENLARSRVALRVAVAQVFRASALMT
jgi:hypothetical protein